MNGTGETLSSNDGSSFASQEFQNSCATRLACCAGGIADHGSVRRNTALAFGIFSHVSAFSVLLMIL